MEKCHICKNECDWECECCGFPVCENCTVPYDQFTQVDYTLCNSCGDRHDSARADEYYEGLKEQEIKDKIRKEKNEKAREYYHSPQAVEKRRLKKIELQELRKREDAERAERLAGIFSNLFKYM